MPPVDRLKYLEENSPVENITALFYLMTVVFCAWQFISEHRGIWFGLGMLALFAFLDEFSYGLSFFHIAAPQLGHRYAIDGLHDFLKAAAKESRRWLRKGSNVPVLLWSSALILLAGVVLILRKRFITFVRQVLPRYSLSIVFLVIVVILGLLSQTIDLIESLPESFKVVEELAEMNASLALLFCAMSIKVAPRITASQG
ncbi:MAG: hypothetical protein ACOY16_09835 [Chloroflexota bacterium]